MPDASEENQIGHVINPVMATPAALAPPVTDSEGCLSVPGQQAEVSRAAVATVTGTDVHGLPVAVIGTGVLARCLQHETDHLRGIVYVGVLSTEERAAILATAGLPTRHRRGPGQPLAERGRVAAEDAGHQAKGQSPERTSGVVIMKSWGSRWTEASVGPRSDPFVKPC